MTWETGHPCMHVTPSGCGGLGHTSLNSSVLLVASYDSVDSPSRTPQEGFPLGDLRTVPEWGLWWGGDDGSGWGGMAGSLGAGAPDQAACPAYRGPVRPDLPLAADLELAGAGGLGLLQVLAAIGLHRQAAVGVHLAAQDLAVLHAQAAGFAALGPLSDVPASSGMREREKAGSPSAGEEGTPPRARTTPRAKTHRTISTITGGGGVALTPEHSLTVRPREAM